MRLTFKAPTATSGQKVAAKCPEAICHCAPAGQTTDINSYSSWKLCIFWTTCIQSCKTEKQVKHNDTQSIKIDLS